MKFYSPVGKGISLLRAQGSISYVQSNMETYDMDDREWVERLANQYGCFSSGNFARRYQRNRNGFMVVTGNSSSALA